MPVKPVVKISILRDLVSGPKAGSVLKEGRTGYVWPALYKLEHDGYVVQDKDTKAYHITAEGLCWLAKQEGGQ